MVPATIMSVPVVGDLEDWRILQWCGSVQVHNGGPKQNHETVGSCRSVMINYCAEQHDCSATQKLVGADLFTSSEHSFE